MSAQLKPLRTDEEIKAVPLSEPVLVQLETPGPIDNGELQEPATPDGGDQHSAVKSLQDQLEALKAADKQRQQALERAENERKEALRLAKEREDEARRARSEREQSETDLIAAALAGAQAEVASAKQAYRVAMENVDYAAAAEAQEKIARAASNVQMYERAASEAAERQERRGTEPEPKPASPPSQTDVMAAIDADVRLLPKEKDWLKSHPEVMIDQALNSELGVAYNRAVRAGHVRGTEGYFKFLDEFMGYAKPAASPETSDQGYAIMAAPVTRDTPSLATGRTTSSQVHLSSDERDLARAMGVSETAWARQKLALEQDKRSNPEKYARRG